LVCREGVMRSLIVAIVAAAVGPPLALADPVRLMCEGEMMHGNATQNSTLLLTIDLGAGTVEVSGWGKAPIISKPEDEALTFRTGTGPVGGIPTGVINRFTGRAGIGLGERTFVGQCRTAQRLF
jgi:hypothetical protein